MPVWWMRMASAGRGGREAGQARVVREGRGAKEWPATKGVSLVRQGLAELTGPQGLTDRTAVRRLGRS